MFKIKAYRKGGMGSIFLPRPTAWAIHSGGIYKYFVVPV